ncbi:putative membrane protein [Kibdelosporangium banguiense]|uniref:Membrane protein n=1 Tax=Kibdelosporangium banguiense TaxID=1365924 RepID=A0ABS4TSA4_9PSEU|nr:DUF1772 domain-containing protein [Kibdelosporangium banguiense]MBP2327291.1 putative membrane protein [Kibdelosporangium banguiense]
MLELLVPVVLLANGLAAGVLVGTQLGGWPLLESLPPAGYVSAHAFFSTRFDPFMPVCFVAAAVGDVVLGVLADRAVTAVLFLTAALLTLGSVVVSLVKNVPLNRWIRTLDPDRLPADFAERDPRRRWGGWNRARTALAVLALLFNCVAVGLLL